MHQLVDWIVNTVGNMGYIGIFIMMMLESTVIPVPSEAAMIPAGYLAGIGEMNFLLALFVGTLGAIVGSMINYAFGYFLGEKVIQGLIHRYGKYVFLKIEHYLKSEIFFLKHGIITIFLARFIPVVRHIISLPAGVFKIHLGKFALYTGIGAGLWNLALMIIGYIAGENREIITQYSHELLIGVLIFVAFVIFIYLFMYKKINEKKDFLEIEKKFELNDEDYQKIKKALTLDKKEKIEDIYYDTPDYNLITKGQHCRMRNGKLELKIRVGEISFQKIYGENAKKRLAEIGFPFETLQKAYSIDTDREKYTGEYKEHNFVVDIDRHQYGERYEIEVEAQNEEIGNILIDEIVQKLGLQGILSPELKTKKMLHIEAQNPELFEILKDLKAKKQNKIL